MKKLLLVISIIVTAVTMKAFAGPGDTIVVQAFTFGSPQDAWFVFPSDTVRFEKILMKYTLKCNPAQSPACGEWDYLTYTYLYKNTGFLDSTQIHQPTYTVNGTSPDSFSYMQTPSWKYLPAWQYFMVNTSTSSLSTYQLGTGTVAATAPFGASHPVSRSQYLWKAGEIAAAGMTAGSITGIQFYITSSGGEVHNLTIRMKPATLDSLTQTNFANDGFTTVYAKNTAFQLTGSNSLQFTTPFNWDGTSNIIIDISYENNAPATDNVVNAATAGFTAGLTSSGSDRVAAFHSFGYVDVPVNDQVAAIDSFVTISFWCYGTPELQPMDGTAFEAVDSLQNRLLNSHLPWSDSHVYWDAGFSGTGYDRIHKVATAPQIKGQWNYWAFTKNVATGWMRIYLNGVQWYTGSNKTKSMKGIKYFKIGKGNWNGSKTYEGKIDEFAVFNQELPAAIIQEYMYKKIDASHPYYNNLALYYQFDDGNYQTFSDAAPGNHAPADAAGVDNPFRDADEIISFNPTSLRPNITFERGVYDQYIDSVFVVDSAVTTPVQLITYYDSVNNPGDATSIENVWLPYYHYVFNAQGEVVDSSLVAPDYTLLLDYYDWYHKYPQVIRYELARYITPYGINLSLGDGFTWTFDVSDYRPLLADSVHLNAGNWQELLDVKFLMIEGTPPRDVLSVQNLWNGGFNYGQSSDPIENHLQPLTIDIPADAANARWKSRITGHGMDSPQNCAEFCAKTHYYKVNNVQQFSKLVWRNNCDLNPVYPQGGTWVYDRANWCPGAEVWTYNWELSPFLTPGSAVTLDHDVQAYTSTYGWDYYQIEDQLVTYSAPNFSLDASVDDILAPGTDQMWGRMNPVCTNPVIKISNGGATTLTSLTISYGLNGATPSVYNWTGNLKFTESATITLGSFEWVPNATEFVVTIAKPNGGSDEYDHNNTATSHFVYPVVMPGEFYIEFKTNNYADENSYTLKDESGNILIDKSGLDPNIIYRDTVSLTAGCYKFELTDSGEDGLTWWANPYQGGGYVRFRNTTNGAIIKNFNSDFGGQVYQQFTVGLTTGTGDCIFTDKTMVDIYPNPTNGRCYIDISLPERTDGYLEIRDLLGKIVYTEKFLNQTAESFDVDLSPFGRGVYFITFSSGKDHITKKLMVQ
ncbi:MAG: T9SS type A sorting domain-containing protein [Chitinophagales bacterium]|nr:T9SS type A sorting domain-containing protein [Chitinophagales bacterium]